MYTWGKVTLVSLLFVVLANFVMAQEATAAPEGVPVTDLWQFTFTGTGDSGSPSSRTFNVQLTQLGTLVFGSVVLERWVGENKNGTLSIRTLSQPAKGKQAQQGGPVMTGAFDLHKNASGNWKGEGYSMAPGVQSKLPFETFTVTAMKLHPNSGQQPLSIDWCSLLDINEIVQQIFDETFFHPMDVCSADIDGGGAYLFGSVGPGNEEHPYAAVTVYFPWEKVVCSSRTYGFAITSQGRYASAQDIVQGLVAFSDLLSFLHIAPSDLGQELTNLFNTYGDFAVSIGYNYNTGSVSMYVNTGSNAQAGICNAVMNSKIVNAISNAFDRGHGFYPYCGGSINDQNHLTRDIIPDPTLHCSTPMVFIYLFGTINVQYD